MKTQIALIRLEFPPHKRDRIYLHKIHTLLNVQPYMKGRMYRTSPNLSMPSIVWHYYL